MKFFFFSILFSFLFSSLAAQFENNPLPRKGVRSVSEFICGYEVNDTGAVEKDSTGLKLISYAAYNAAGNPIVTRDMKITNSWNEMDFDNEETSFYDAYKNNVSEHGYDTVKFFYNAEGNLIKKDRGFDEDGDHCIVTYSYHKKNCVQDVMQCGGETYYIDEYSFDSLGRPDNSFSTIGISPWKTTKTCYDSQGRVSKTFIRFHSDTSTRIDSALHFYTDGIHTVVATDYGTLLRETYDKHDSLLSRTKFEILKDTFALTKIYFGSAVFHLTENSSAHCFYMLEDTLSIVRDEKGKPISSLHEKYYDDKNKTSIANGIYDSLGRIAEVKLLEEFTFYDTLKKVPIEAERWEYNSKGFVSRHLYYNIFYSEILSDNNLFREADYYYNTKNELKEERIYNGWRQLVQRKIIKINYY